MLNTRKYSKIVHIVQNFTYSKIVHIAVQLYNKSCNTYLSRKNWIYFVVFSFLLTFSVTIKKKICFKSYRANLILWTGIEYKEEWVCAKMTFINVI